MTTKEAIKIVESYKEHASVDTKATLNYIIKEFVYRAEEELEDFDKGQREQFLAGKEGEDAPNSVVN